MAKIRHDLLEELHKDCADHDFHAAEQELDTNTDLPRAIHDLTAEIHDRIISGSEPGK